jgi:hypothetical protein
MQDYLAQAEQHAGWGFGHFDQLIEEAARGRRPADQDRHFKIG